MPVVMVAAMTTQANRASQAMLWELWRAVAKTLLDQLTSTPPGEVKASLINVARAFLADNGIVVGGVHDPRQTRDELSRLLETIPDFNEGWSVLNQH